MTWGARESLTTLPHRSIWGSATRRRTGAPYGEALPDVYVNGHYIGALDVTRWYPVNVVTSVRYITSSSARFHFGREHQGGVILLTVRP